MSEYRIVFLGDIVGRPGRQAVFNRLPDVFEKYDPLFVVANGENAASGVGITADVAEDLFRNGVDAITLGNHAFAKRDIYHYLDSGKPIVRPANLPDGAPGRGLIQVTHGEVTLAIVNLCGRVFLDGYDDPFRAFDAIQPQAGSAHLLVDFHAEATSEKIAFGYHAAGRATAVIGTHTHVATADEAVLPGGTAYITDVGMCGPMPSVLGMDKEIILRRFRTSMPSRFEVASEPGVISCVVISVEKDTGRAIRIERVSYPK